MSNVPWKGPVKFYEFGSNFVIRDVQNRPVLQIQPLNPNEVGNHFHPVLRERGRILAELMNQYSMDGAIDQPVPDVPADVIVGLQQAREGKLVDHVEEPPKKKGWPKGKKRG